MTTTTSTPRTCQGRPRCSHQAVWRITWKSGDPKNPHVRFLCDAHYINDFRDRVTEKTITVEPTQ